MLGYYADREELITVDGAAPVDDVHTAVLAGLRRVQPAPQA